MKESHFRILVVTRGREIHYEIQQLVKPLFRKERWVYCYHNYSLEKAKAHIEWLTSPVHKEVYIEDEE